MRFSWPTFEGTQKFNPSEGEFVMKQNLTISVSKQPKPGGIVNVRKITMRERILRLLFGAPCKMTILIPGDSVEEVAIKEVMGGDALETV